MINPDYLRPGRLVESDDPEIMSFAQAAAGSGGDDIQRMIAVYLAVRDQVIYDPYDCLGRPESCSAKRALQRRRGFCIPKAALLAACARSLGVPARLGYADVRNHLASKRLLVANNGDVFRWHSYTELFLEGKWVKATPAFDIALCDRAGIHPLEFDGRTDSLFHSFDRQDRKHMEYVADHGVFAEVPYDLARERWARDCPAVLDDSYAAGAKAFAEEVIKPE